MTDPDEDAADETWIDRPSSDAAMRYIFAAVWVVFSHFSSEVKAGEVLDVLLTEVERSRLGWGDSNLPSYRSLLAWAHITLNKQIDSPQVKHITIERFLALRAALGTMFDLEGDNGTIPYIYSSFVHFSVCCLLLEYPFSLAHAKLDSSSTFELHLVPALTALLSAIYYLGILELSLSFLKPLRSRHRCCITAPPLIDPVAIVAECHE
eukprot:CAMPEP_0175163940 /NCGR_PEP_ID=MMETSP0087-20121206/26083_1 /TAXON_ID=136419 /ORGANISM="Unknown Unknown, Strain D1" /LENGTH=207 /DNA_ID=CAMNT_0016452809 /DNA_START=319 /DNA_END=939 /DNA_ORIENTATION=-